MIKLTCSCLLVGKHSYNSMTTVETIKELAARPEEYAMLQREVQECFRRRRVNY